MPEVLAPREPGLLPQLVQVHPARVPSPQPVVPQHDALVRDAGQYGGVRRLIHLSAPEFILPRA